MQNIKKIKYYIPPTLIWKLSSLLELESTRFCIQTEEICFDDPKSTYHHGSKSKFVWP